ncbi:MULTISPECIES: tyrosine-type recombinase/integrase [Stenotrophomonas]|uniref:tyrosine-type recombinase/integrase n=1 Tax=Stenotrophomonas TaxID=40323 RepID=UPI002DB96110|nr:MULTISPECIES: tyrosine-type recombinase/integrase [Stenotrophomonas]MEC4339663.1 tyrosine-type recombinase/integrase [Stenotrophomonas pavanii]
MRSRYRIDGRLISLCIMAEGSARPQEEPAKTGAAPRNKKAALPPLPFDAVRERIARELKLRAGSSAGKAESSMPAHRPGLGSLTVSFATMDVAHLPILLPGLRLNLNEQQKEVALTNLRAFAEHGATGLADNSQRAMRACWINWLAYCEHAHHAVLPITIDSLRPFIDLLVDGQRKRSTLELHINSLRAASKFYGCPDPMESLIAKAYWKDVCRKKLVKAKTSAQGMTRADVAAMVDDLDLSIPRQARDAALVRAAYDLFARREELATAKWEDFELQAGEIGIYTVPHSKTDQEGESITVAISVETVEALLAWREHASKSTPYVFHAMRPRRVIRVAGQDDVRVFEHLHPGEVNVIFNRLGQESGVLKGRRAFSGHSGRVGAAQDLTDAGADVGLLMRLGRWTSSKMPAHYGRAGLAKNSHSEREALLAKLPKK